jgi:magnesium-transporting ATPase (P-type)
MTTGEAKALVLATGMQTVFGGIARLTQTTADAPSPLQQEIGKLSRVIAVLAVAIGLVVFVVGAFVGLPTQASVVFSIGIIVANVPEGLLPTMTLSGAGWRWGQSLSADSVTYRQATTACLTAIVLMQVVNVHLCRSRVTSIFALPIFSNPLITLGIVAEIGIILMIDYTPAGHTLFATAPIGWRDWVMVLPFALGLLMLEEGRKALMRRGAEPSRTDRSASTGLARPAAPPPTL